MTAATARSFALGLIAAASKTKPTSSSCMPENVPAPAFLRYGGWTFGFDAFEHPVITLLAGLEDQKVMHYQMSAKLFPPGRGSTPEDWRTLGEVFSAMTAETGYANHRTGMPEPVLPIESTHPNSTIMWLWHGDGSPVDDGVVQATRAVLLKIQEAQRASAVQTGLAKPIKEEIKRNDRCPCGSGKKFKKCHGNN